MGFQATTQPTHHVLCTLRWAPPMGFQAVQPTHHTRCTPGWGWGTCGFPGHPAIANRRVHPVGCVVGREPRVGLVIPRRVQDVQGVPLVAAGAVPPQLDLTGDPHHTDTGGYRHRLHSVKSTGFIAFCLGAYWVPGYPGQPEIVPHILCTPCCTPMNFQADPAMTPHLMHP